MRALQALPVLFLLAVLGCSDTTVSAGIQGAVNDEQARPIAGATVTLAPLGLVATTGNDGSYNLKLPATLPPYANLTYTAPGYSSVTRSVLKVTSSMYLLPVQLRAAHMVKITIPEAGQPAAQVTNQLSDGSVTLGIAAGALVDAAGTTVHGDANVELTYWHPLAPPDSMPTLLLAAQNGNLPVALQTFGMANVAAEQNNVPLQVASGANITLVFQVPAKQMPQIAVGGVPNLYVLDPNVGLWVGFAKPERSTVAVRAAAREPVVRDMQWPGYAVQPYSATNTTVVYDPNTGRYTTTLPYFAAWNVDGELPTSDGGCVQGNVINACDPNAKFVGQPVTFWALGFEQLADYHAVTDSLGNFCINIGVSPYQATNNGDPQDTYNYTINYFLSGATMDDTSECNPLPQSCRVCNDYYESFTAHFCNVCQLDVPGDPPFHDPNLTPPTPYSDTCSPPTPTANLNACHFCPGTAPSACTMPNTFDAQNHLYANGDTYIGCAKLEPVVIKPIGCNCEYRGGTCSGSGIGTCCAGNDAKASACNGMNTCVACNKVRGDVCTQSDGCCDPLGKEELICGDNVCVPAGDPTFTE